MTNNKNVGEKIMQIRKLKNITIEELAIRSNLSIKQITQIEEDKILPSLTPLIKIARALSVRLGTFLDDQEQLGPVVSRSGEKNHSMSFTNSNQSSHSHLDFFALAKDKSGRHMEPFLIDIHPGESEEHLLSSHEGEEFIYVFEGSVKVNYGKDIYILNSGDTIYFDSIIEHHVHSSNNETAKILAVVYTPV